MTNVALFTLAYTGVTMVWFLLLVCFSTLVYDVSHERWGSFLWTGVILFWPVVIPALLLCLLVTWVRSLRR